MSKTRLEAFSDAVIAIALTIMVLELKVPHGTDLVSLVPLLPIFLCYVLSFVHIGIYWNNHHHMLHLAKKVNGTVLWTNMHLLFWLSLIPFVTGWMGENHFATIPVAGYGFVMLMSGVAYYILSQTLIAHHGKESQLARAFGKDFKGVISVVIYVAGIALSLVSPWISVSCYILVALIWFIPDKRVEKILHEIKE